ncbi:MAG: hypothetical protein JSW27_08550 [Phycisphaerales bacterium]|nr:MAG: hypothetical protein JSW27_08550 [Phycisphaerales bacterium]
MARFLRILIWSAAIIECVAAAALGAYVIVREKPGGRVEPCATQAVTARKDQVDEPIVRTTRGDRYYHRRSCRYVRQSKIAMPLSRAQLHHRPCSRCKPPH